MNCGQDFRPDKEFFWALQAAASQLRALLSDQTFKEYKKVEEMIPGLGPKGKERTVEDFIRARDTALRSLYKGAGLL